MTHYWWALERADSPAIRQFLRDMMLNPNKPPQYRDMAGITLFIRFGAEERLQEYLKAFETKRMPFEIATGQTDAVGKSDPDRLLREVGNRVRANPDLANQDACRQVVQSVSRKASREGRRELGNAIRDGLSRRPSLSAKERNELELSANFLTEATN